MQRPQRIRIKNESEKLQSLPEGKEYFQDLGGDGDILFLGLGPNPCQALELFSEEGKAHYIECPDFEKQIPTVRKISNKFTRINPEELDALPEKNFRLILYTPNKRLFPSFWEPIISKLALQKTAFFSKIKSKTVWIPGNDNSLLVPELSRAFAGADFTYRVIAPDAMQRDLLSLLNQERPEIIFSINFNGLDNSGETYFMLREAGVKVVVWMVDNPFHIISGIKSEYWKEVPMLVTDEWFVNPLKDLGAKKVNHLPLATDPEFFNPDVPEYTGLENRTVFAGRSSFPKKDTFFAGCSFSTQDEQAAIKAIANGIKPDFEWWAKRDELTSFWPGKNVRDTGFKTEQSGTIWRTQALDNAGTNLTIFGDKGWRELLTNADIRPPIDYFTVLPAIYAGAAITLNMTSPLLPNGLTQRNFDVWSAGGFLLTDYTPGLSIFPEDLVAECSFSKPKDLPALSDKFHANPRLRKALSKKWREIILKDHTYRNRVINILDFIN
ncbi:glycosyltransferase family protein [Maridesulfovibrio frigidus]|nr:glycosyltransferase [Maridesulfovibrio frigidus]